MSRRYLATVKCLEHYMHSVFVEWWNLEENFGGSCCLSYQQSEACVQQKQRTVPFNKVTFYYWLILLNTILGQLPKTLRSSKATWALNYKFSIRPHRLTQVPRIWKTESTSERYSLFWVTYKFPSKQNTKCAHLKLSSYLCKIYLKWSNLSNWNKIYNPY